MLLLYMNDMIVAGNSKHCISTLKAQLTGEFDTKDLGAISQILDIKVL